jgi:hypothetical protein
MRGVARFALLGFWQAKIRSIIQRSNARVAFYRRRSRVCMQRSSTRNSRRERAQVCHRRNRNWHWVIGCVNIPCMSGRPQPQRRQVALILANLKGIKHEIKDSDARTERSGYRIFHRIGSSSQSRTFHIS